MRKALGGFCFLVVFAFASCAHLSSRNQSAATVGELDFWVDSSTRKAMENESRPPNSTQAIHLSAAKNEYEAAQVILRPREPIRNLRISVGDFKGAPEKTISNKNIEIRYATYVHLPAFDRTAPDPLPPLANLDLEPDRNQPIYIIVKVPTESAAGEYHAPMTLEWDGGELRTDVHLTVWDFQLPETPSCTTSFGCSYSIPDRVHGVQGDPEKSLELNRKYYEMLLDYRASPYHLPVPYDSPEAPSYYADPRLTRFVIPYSEKDEELKKTIDTVKRNGGWKKGYFYVVDESITRDQYEKLHQTSERIRKLAPDARIIGTFYRRPDFDDTQTVIEAAAKDVNLWCLSSGFYAMDPELRKQVHEKQEEGDMLWWYVCCGPGEPYCNFFVEMSSMQHRILFWQQKMSHVSGLLYWNTTHWTDVKNNNAILDPWTNIATFYFLEKDIYGDGSLLYPGAKVGINGPVPSVRLLNIRDGIEDYEYLCLLEKKRGRGAVDEAISKLVKSWTEYSQDPGQLDEVRKEIAGVLSAAQ